MRIFWLLVGVCSRVQGIQLPRNPLTIATNLASTFESLNFEIGSMSSTERTVHTTVDAPGNEVLIRIPWRRIITGNIGAATPLGRAATTLPSTTANDLLCCWLVTASKKQSNGEADPDDLFHQSLPTQEELCHIPMLWSAKDCETLQGSHLRTMISERKASTLDYVSALKKACSQLGEDVWCDSLTPDLWLWAQAIVKSRGLLVPNFDDKENRQPLGSYIGEANSHPQDFIPVLVPLADMLNHRYLNDGVNGALCDWGLERDGGAFVVKSLGYIPARTELSISYGKIGAAGSLLSYGFVPRCPLSMKSIDFEYAVVALNFGNLLQQSQSRETDDKESTLRNENSEKKKAWMQGEASRMPYSFPFLPQTFESSQGDRDLLLSIGNRAGFEALLSLLRVAVSTPKELFQLKMNEKGQRTDLLSANVLAQTPFGWHNEVAAMKLLGLVARRQLDAYSTSLESDMEVLVSGAVDTMRTNHANALQVVSGEKKVLQRAETISSIAGKHLSDCEGSLNAELSGFNYNVLLNFMISSSSPLSFEWQ
mmetsp:Transcript_23849/g.43612  ORF Transcript_23849/g.43612 Transcript_23849/m.43612 type:complete len:539 (-) Transcript_23849:86-1702(-)